MYAISILLPRARTSRFGLPLVLLVLLGVSTMQSAQLRADAQRQDVIRTLAWSPDGKLLASGSENGQISLWGAQGQPVRRFPIQQERIIRILWSSNNHYLLSWSVDDRALLWATDGRLLSVFQGCNWLNEQAIEWSPDGDLLAVSPETAPLQIWVTAARNGSMGGQGTLMASLGLNMEGDDRDLRLAWSPDGSLLAAGHKYSNIVYIWDFSSAHFDWNYWGITRKGAETTRALKATLQDPRQSEGAFVEHLEWSPDSKVLAIGYIGWTLQLWPRDQALKTLTKYSAEIDGQYDNVELAWSPDGQLLAFGDRYMGKDKLVRVRIWSPDGQPVETIERREDLVAGVAWSQKQVLAVAYHSVSALDLWSSGQSVRSIAPEFDGFVWGVPEWSFDGAYLAMRYNTLSEGSKIQIWTAEGVSLITLSNGTADEDEPSAWSPTNNVMALRGEKDEVRLVDVTSFRNNAASHQILDD